MSVQFPLVKLSTVLSAILFSAGIAAKEATDCPLNLNLTKIQSRSISISWNTANSSCDQNVSISISSSPQTSEWEETVLCNDAEDPVSCTPFFSWIPVFCSDQKCNITSPNILSPCTLYKVHVTRGEKVQAMMITTDEKTPGPPAVVGMQQVAPAQWPNSFSVNWDSVGHLPQCVTGYRVSLRFCGPKHDHGYEWQQDDCGTSHEDVDLEDDHIVHFQIWTFGYDDIVEYEVSVQAITNKKRLGEAKVLRGFINDDEKGLLDPNSPISITTTTTTTTTATTTTTITSTITTMTITTTTTTTKSTTTTFSKAGRCPLSSSLLLVFFMLPYFELL